MHAVTAWLDTISNPHISSRRHLWRYVVLVTTLATCLALLLDTTVQIFYFESWTQIYRQWMLDVVVTVTTAAPVTLMIGKTHQKLLAAKLAYQKLSQTDPLTELPNRRHFMDTITTDCSLKALAIIDLDNFKAINDNFGHDVGDHVLRVVAGRLSLAMQPTHAIGRIGGEEFAAYAPLTCRTDFVRRIEMFRKAVFENPICIANDRITLTVSVGIAFQCEGESLARLYSDADAKMYRAKTTGRNRIVTTTICNDTREERAITSLSA